MTSISLKMYAIVDIETTGGNASTGSITEIAIVITDGKEIMHTYTSLVNPLQPIPLFIEKLTGISDKMVKDAPVFGQIATEVFELLQHKTFVAHNVNFDFSFVAHQLMQHGHALQSRKLCTVRLSRKIFQNLPSYSLGNLCRSLGISNQQRHRAMGDAHATAMLFHQLLENDKHKHIQQMLKKGSRDAYLPIHLNNDDLDKMPNTPGIYYFHDAKGKVIYVGKAKRLQKRVISHFSNNSTSKRKQELIRLVHKISYKECGNEIMMSIMESLEIKKIWPRFNRSQKKFEHKFGICSYIDQRGVMRLGIVKTKKNIITHHNFPLQIDGLRIMNKLAREYSLCPKMCFLQKEKIACVGREENFCEGICDEQEDIQQYNEKVTNAIQTLNKFNPSLAVFGQGRNEKEYSCVVLDKNDFLAVGFVPVYAMQWKKEKLKRNLEPAVINEFIRSIIYAAAESDPTMTVEFD
ncbi:MAG: exonuclease domain-containing protein [Chitinophagaceae bacterium]